MPVSKKNHCRCCVCMYSKGSGGCITTGRKMYENIGSWWKILYCWDTWKMREKLIIIYVHRLRHIRTPFNSKSHWQIILLTLTILFGFFHLPIALGISSNISVRRRVFLQPSCLRRLSTVNHRAWLPSWKYKVTIPNTHGKPYCTYTTFSNHLCNDVGGRRPSSILDGLTVKPGVCRITRRSLKVLNENTSHILEIPTPQTRRWEPLLFLWRNRGCRLFAAIPQWIAAKNIFSAIHCGIAGKVASTVSSKEQ